MPAECGVRTCPAQRSAHAAKQQEVVVPLLPAVSCRLLPSTGRQRAQAAKTSYKQAGRKADCVPPPSRHHGRCLLYLRCRFLKRLREGAHQPQRSRRRRQRLPRLMPLLLAAVGWAAALAAVAAAIASIVVAVAAAAIAAQQVQRGGHPKVV